MSSFLWISPCFLLDFKHFESSGHVLIFINLDRMPGTWWALRKCLRNELFFGKRFYSRSCIPGKALWWPRLMGTTPTLHKPSRPPSQPLGPLPTSSSRGRGSGTSKAQTYLRSRFGVHKSALTWGAECRTSLCTSEGPFLLNQGAGPP